MKKSAFISVILLIFSVLSIAQAVTHEPGATVRLRYEVADNFLFLGTNRHFWDDTAHIRLRLQVWDKIKFNDNLSFYLRGATEPRYYAAATHRVSLDEDNNLKRLDQDELFVDNIYVDIKKIFNLPLNLRIGRQDFLGKDMYGEGFIIFDGTPGDGSRSFYFNAAKLQWNISEKDSIDFVYVSNPVTDTYLPVIHPSIYDFHISDFQLYIDHKKRLTASDEKGFWIYGRIKPSENIILEPYYVYKHEDGWSRALFYPPWDRTPDLNFHTIGIRAVFKWGEWSLKGEIAKQLGEYSNGKDLSALGGYIFLAKSFSNVSLSPKVEIGCVYLSGDDPATQKDEGWNPVFSKAGLWNELFSYIVLSETIHRGGPLPGYWSNLESVITKLYLNPLKNLNISLSYQHLWADKRTNINEITKPPLKRLIGPMFTDKGKDRGDMFTFLTTYKFTKNLDGLFQLEYFIPGSFYASEAKNAAFIRWQLLYKL